MKASLVRSVPATSVAPSAPASGRVTAPVRGPHELRVLVLERDRALRQGCVGFFDAQGCAVHATSDADEALARLREAAWDLVLVDLDAADGNGLGVVRAMRAVRPDALLVVVTAHAVDAAGIEAMQVGAWDYLLKPFTPDHLQVLLGRATHVVLTGRARRGATGDAAPARATVADPVTCIGTAPAFRRAVELARRVAASDASVMLAGESGTGKEVIAQLIHHLSRRAAKRIVPVNCAALPDALLESEMFGHRKGSFTGADRDKAGLLEAASGSTLFLDELSDMSLRLQAKLLRVIQDGVVRRVGSEKQDAVVDVRFVSATNVHPNEAVARGLLRKDLFYRLRVVLIELPPLRERLEDIPLLAEHFLDVYWRRYHAGEEPRPKFAAATLQALAARQWPGNVRELQNVIEHVAVLAQPGGTIRPDDVPFYDDPSEPSTTTDTLQIPGAMLEQDYYPARDRLVAEFDRAYLSKLVARAGGNMSKASRIASIDRTTLYRLVERYGLGGRGGAADGASADAAETAA